MIKISNEISQKAFSGEDGALELLDYAQEKMFNIYKTDEGTTHKLNDALDRVLKEIQAIQKTGAPTGITTGLDIDDAILGFEDSKYYVIAARPSMGKTALALTIMRRIAKSNKKAGILSLETSSKSLTYRLLSSVSRISTERMRSGRLTDREYEEIESAAGKLWDYGIYLDDTLSLTDQQLRAKVRSLVQKHDLDIVFIDFLQLLTSSGETREREVANISRAIKLLCKECDIPIVALSQLSRAVEQRRPPKPQLSDLRESGTIEQDADCVMFLYRPEYYDITQYPDGETTEGVAEVIIAKNKDGRTGTKKLLFIKDQMRFENMSPIKNNEVQF